MTPKLQKMLAIGALMFGGGALFYLPAKVALSVFGSYFVMSWVYALIIAMINERDERVIAEMEELFGKNVMGNEEKEDA